MVISHFLLPVCVFVTEIQRVFCAIAVLPAKWVCLMQCEESIIQISVYETI